MYDDWQGGGGSRCSIRTSGRNWIPLGHAQLQLGVALVQLPYGGGTSQQQCATGSGRTA